MTNREVLFRMSNTILAQFLCSEDFIAIKRSWTQSIDGVAQWLSWEATQEFIAKWLNNAVLDNSCPVEVGDYVYFPKYTLGELDGQVAKRQVQRIDTIIVLGPDNCGTKASLSPDLYNKEWFTDPEKAKSAVKEKLGEFGNEVNAYQFVIIPESPCVKCGCSEFVKVKTGSIFGLYCERCGNFIKWLSGDEKRFDEKDGAIYISNEIPVLGVNDVSWRGNK